jgi:hypothetical protein
MHRRKRLQWGITPTDGRALRSMGVMPCFWGFHLDKTHEAGILPGRFAVVFSNVFK